MKRIVTVIVIVAAFISCQREELAEPAKSIHVFKAYMEDVRNETKTMIREDNRIVWSDGDEIGVDGPYGGIYEIDPEYVGTSEGVFSLSYAEYESDIPVSIAKYPIAPVHFFYTVGRHKTSNNELAANEYEYIDCKLPHTQSYCFDNFSSNSFPMVAVTTSPEDDILNFKNLCGVMKLQLKGDAIIRSILIQGNDDEKLSGYFDLIVSVGGLPRVIMAEDAYESVRLDCGEGVKLDKDTATDFYIVIPPVVFERGFKVVVTDSDDDKYVIEAAVKNQVERSSILVMPAIDLADFPAASGDDEIIDFKDPVVKEILLRHGIDGNGDGDISYKEAALTTSLSFTIDDAYSSDYTYDIIEFDEFQYFTGITDITQMFFGCDIQTITLPESLSEIGAGAFEWCDSLRRVTIPDCVKIIGEGAFSGCYSLEHIDLPESLEVIDDNAFCETNLKSIELPSSLKVIGEIAFSESKLVSVELPSSLISLGDEVFSGCPDLMEINVKEGTQGYYSLDGVLYSNDGTLLTFPPAKPCDDYSVPEGITSIGESAFSCCIRLQSISLPNSVKYIGNDAFSGCLKLSEISVPEGVVNILGGTFEGCRGLKALHIPSTLESIGDHAFDGCDELANVYISDLAKWCSVQFGLTSLGEESGWTIAGYSSPLYRGADLYLNGELVTELTIPEGITEIGNSFTGCGSIEEVIIPEGVKKIRSEAFADCIDLKSISLPGSLESIDDSAFRNCDNLSSVYITDITKWCNVGLDVWGSFSNPLHYGADLYLNNEKVTDLTLPSDVKTLGNSFAGCGSITSVTIPITTTKIEDNAFKGCSNLLNIYMKSEAAMPIGNMGLDDRVYINVPAASHEDYMSENSNIRNIVAYYYGQTWGISGTFNNWGETDDIPMLDEGGYYVAKGVELSSSTEFKFRLDNSWSINYGAVASVAVAENVSNNTKSYGPNIMVTTPGCYDIYLSKHYDEYFVMASGMSPDEL